MKAFIILCIITLSSCKFKARNDNEIVSNQEMFIKDQANLKRVEDSLAIANMYKPQSNEDSFNQNKSKLEKTQSSLDADTYSTLVKIQTRLKKRGLDICQVNADLENLAADARADAKSKFPGGDYLSQSEYSAKIQGIRRKAYFKKYGIREADAITVTMIFVRHGEIDFCD